MLPAWQLQMATGAVKGEESAVNITHLLDRIEAYHPDLDPGLLRRAFSVASDAHAGQTRLSGDPYITHPLAVAMTLAELELDEATIAAGLLHDVVEDTGVASQVVREEFGEEIAGLVEGVTKLSRIDFRSQREHQAENLRKMLLAMARDLRVIFIKLADRLHNMRTLQALPEERRREVAEETLQVFAPLADRLGIWMLKWELEDCSLRYLDPGGYQAVGRNVKRTRPERERMIGEAIRQIRERLEQGGITAEITGRPKHFYSIYQKMQTQKVDFDDIRDLEAIRIVVDSIPDCYEALGLVHDLWVPIKDMFSDYIAKPKPNGYRSLHTKVMRPGGKVIEVQIRTREMHRTAEYGWAAHWHYKEGGRPDKLEERLPWLRQLLEHPYDRDSRQWIESLDLFKDEVFVFTPQRDVINLPAGSTPVDFAYRIHTDIGNHCSRAKANGEIVPLSYTLQNGDVIEIITRSNARPSLDWRSFVATPQAKTRINQWYRRQRRDESIQHGRTLLHEECKRVSVEPAELMRPEGMGKVARRFNYHSGEDLVAAVGFGEVSAEAVINRLRDLLEPTPRPMVLMPSPVRAQGALRLGIAAQGVSDILFRLSKCCSPVPGDAIVGYITRGKGVAVHRVSCPNISHIIENEPQRLIRVAWTLSEETYYPATVEIEALDRVGLLSDITAILSESKTNIRSAKVRTRKDGRAHMELVLDIQDIQHLRRLTDSLNELPDIISVHRVGIPQT